MVKIPDEVSSGSLSAANRVREPNDSEKEILRVLGEVTWLMGRCPLHRHIFVGELEWMVLPPLVLSQARLFRNGQGAPSTYVSWALVSGEVNERLKRGEPRMRPTDWRSGSNPWIYDLVAPSGGGDEALASIRKSIFADKVVPVFVRAPGPNPIHAAGDNA